MTTTTADTGGLAITRRSWKSVLAPLAGLGLVAGLVALLVSPAGDETGETPREVVAYATSHDGWSVAIQLFALAAIVLGGAFVAGLRTRLARVATPTESALILIGGIAFTLCFVLALTIWTAPLIDVPDESARALAQAEAYLAVDDVGWFLLGAGGVGAALMAIPSSLAAIRAGVPAWLGWLGVAAGIASLGTVAFLGMFAWMAWIVAASIMMFVTGRES